MGFRIVEDRPTPPQVYNWRMFLFATTASAGAMVFGYDGAFFGTTYARASFKQAFGINAMSKSEQTSTSANLTSCYLAAGFFGALFAWPMMETVGRRFTLRVSSIIFVIGAVLMTAASHQISLIYAGRAITGFASGSLTAVIPTFIAETSPPGIRGTMTGAFEVSYQAGALVGFWINYGISKNLDLSSAKSFRIPMAVQLIPGGLLVLGSFILVESPALLLRQGKVEQALRNLSYLRQLPEDHQYIREEVSIAQAKIEEELSMSGGQKGLVPYLKGAFRELSKKHLRHRLIITFFMFAFQNWSGAAAINYYSPTLFAAIGVSDVNLYTGIYGLLKAIGSFVFFILIVDRSGRRIPWLLSASSCAVCLLYLSIYIKVLSGHTGSLDGGLKSAGNGATAFVMLYSLFWSFGGNGLPWVVSSELFPIRLRSLTGAYGAMCQWLTQFSCTEAFPHMIASKMGLWGTFLFFVCSCVATTIFTFIWVPETKGIPIESMETLFSGPVRHAAWRQKSVYPPEGIPPLPEHIAETAAENDKDKVEEHQLEYA